MAKQAYIGADGTARKIKKGYIGVNGTARRVKKAYIGIGGKARPCWGGGTFVQYGAITSMSGDRGGTAAANAGEFLLIADGAQSFSVGATHYAAVDAYSPLLTRASAPNRTASGYHNHPNCGGASTGTGYALFAGGYNATSGVGHTYVDAYDETLTKTTATRLPGAYHNLAGFTMNGKAVFASSITVSYDSALTQTTTDGLSGSNRPNTARAGDYCILTADEVKNAIAYDANLTRMTLTQSQYGCTGCTGDGYALFASGTTAYAYTPDLVQVSLDPLSASRTWMATVHLDGFSAFGGSGTAAAASTLDVYQGVTRLQALIMKQARQYPASGTAGDYALFCGGTYNATAEAFTLI